MKTNITTTLSLLALALIATTGTAKAINESKSWSYGNSNFSSDGTVTLSDSKANGVYTLQANAVANGRVLGIRVRNIANGNASVSVNRQSRGNAKAKLTLGGTVVCDYNKAYSASLSYSRTAFEKTWTVGTAQFMVGPVPIVVKGKVSVEASARADIRIGTDPLAEAVITPKFDVAVIASCAAGIPVASVGIEGTLSLLKITLPTKIALHMVTMDNRDLFVVRATGDLVINTLSGHLDAFAEVDVFGFIARHDFPITSWDGNTTTYNLFAHTIRL
jgi:hypothetical protein